jgi:hypothetical protein
LQVLGDPCRICRLPGLRAGLTDLYRFYRVGVSTLANVYPDFATLPQAHRPTIALAADHRMTRPGPVIAHRLR